MPSHQTIDVITTGIVHPTLGAQRRALRALDDAAVALQERGQCWSVRHHYGLGSVVDVCARDPALIVVYVHRRRRNDHVVEALRDYVVRGGAVLGLHSVTASFRGDPGNRELFGACFTGHGSIAPTVLTREPSAPSVSVALPFRLVLTDEMYEHQFTRDVDVWYRWEGGQPAVWTREIEEGRTGYLVPGHRAAVWDSADYRTVLAGMVEWLLRRGGTL